MNTKEEKLKKPDVIHGVRASLRSHLKESSNSQKVFKEERLVSSKSKHIKKTRKAPMTAHSLLFS